MSVYVYIYMCSIKLHGVFGTPVDSLFICVYVYIYIYVPDPRVVLQLLHDGPLSASGSLQRQGCPTFSHIELSSLYKIWRLPQ